MQILSHELFFVLIQVIQNTQQTVIRCDFCCTCMYNNINYTIPMFLKIYASSTKFLYINPPSGKNNWIYALYVM